MLVARLIIQAGAVDVPQRKARNKG